MQAASRASARFASGSFLGNQLAAASAAYGSRCSDFCPGWVAQLVRALSGYTEVGGLRPGGGTYKSQPVNT